MPSCVLRHNREDRPLQERRSFVRRQSDRDLLVRVKELEAAGDRRGDSASHEAERKRRRAIRHTCKVGIQKQMRHSAGTSDVWSVDAIKLKGRLLDLSAQGASLFTREILDTGDELRLAIELPKGPVINTVCTVRWVKSLPEKGGYASGVQFLRVPTKDKRPLVKYLAELDQTAGL
ncbi:MAG: PilZ domain-containing protein [bacterium]|nr:PilZ domain-containing protein [bacterium]